MQLALEGVRSFGCNKSFGAGAYDDVAAPFLAKEWLIGWRNQPLLAPCQSAAAIATFFFTDLTKSKLLQ